MYTHKEKRISEKNNRLKLHCTVLWKPLSLPTIAFKYYFSLMLRNNVSITISKYNLSTSIPLLSLWCKHGKNIRSLLKASNNFLALTFKQMLYIKSRFTSCFFLQNLNSNCRGKSYMNLGENELNF